MDLTVIGLLQELQELDAKDAEEEEDGKIYALWPMSSLHVWSAFDDRGVSEG